MSSVVDKSDPVAEPAASPATRTAGRTTWKPSQEQLILAVTAALLVTFSFTLNGFATVGNIIGLARNVSILGILALGMSVVVIGRGLDLSQIATMASTSALAIYLMGLGLPVSAALCAGFVFAILLGVINGFLIAFVEIPALFATLASSLVIYGVVRYQLGTLIVHVPPQDTALLFIGQGGIFGVPMPVIVFVVSAIVVHLFMSRTGFGRIVYAHGDNAEAARLTGIAIRPLTMLEYSISAAVAFVAGVVDSTSTATMDMAVVQSTQIFDVILVVVLGGVSLVGGRGSVLSVIVGTLLVGTLLNGLTIMDLGTQVQDAVKSLVLLAAILLDNRVHPRDEETAKQGD